MAAILSGIYELIKAWINDTSILNRRIYLRIRGSPSSLAIWNSQLVG